MRHFFRVHFFWILGVVMLLGYAFRPMETIKTIDEKTPLVSPLPLSSDWSPCATFKDAPNPDDAETNYVLYRDFLRAQEYEESYSYWRKVYRDAPAADGQRNTVFSDGIFFYEYFYSQTLDTNYIDSIFMLYDEIEKCYPEGGYVAGRKAFDYYYKYPHRSTKIETYKLFKQSIDTDGMKTNDFVINPFTALLTEMHDSTLVSDEEAKRYSDLVLEIIANGLEKCEGVYCERWKIIEEYTPVRLEYFESVKGFYGCEHYVEKYYPDFEAYPDSCDLAREVAARLSWGGCGEGNAAYDTLQAVLSSNECRIAFAGVAGVGVQCLQNGDYDCAIENLLQAANEEDEPVRKSELLLLVSKVYYVHKRSFSNARSYAQQAADVRPNWGAPYILIGRMYASSGPLCGSGRGWNSQVVVWTAIDMWAKAKRIDPDSASEAQKWINQYAQYMPEKGDVFLRNLKVGDSYFVPCWIQRSTKIRTSD